MLAHSLQAVSSVHSMDGDTPHCETRTAHVGGFLICWLRKLPGRLLTGNWENAHAPPRSRKSSRRFQPFQQETTSQETKSLVSASPGGLSSIGHSRQLHWTSFLFGCIELQAHLPFVFTLPPCLAYVWSTSIFGLGVWSIGTVALGEVTSHVLQRPIGCFLFLVFLGPGTLCSLESEAVFLDFGQHEWWHHCVNMKDSHPWS
jgi:hypothetical protein